VVGKARGAELWARRRWRCQHWRKKTGGGRVTCEQPFFFLILTPSSYINHISELEVYQSLEEGLGRGKKVVHAVVEW
jgi:hypothetical protein